MRSKVIKSDPTWGKDVVVTIANPALIELLRSIIAKGVPFRFRTRGFSMSPFIKDGDVGTVFPLHQGMPRIGDVVAFIHPHTAKLALHRVIGRTPQACLIKGDNVWDADGPVPRNNILGCVKKVEREGAPVYVGLGPERFAIAWLNRMGLLLPLVRSCRKILSCLKAGQKKYLMRLRH